MHHQVTIVGRLGRDPEMRYTPEGKAVTTFSVAVTDGFGENKNTIWFKVTAWEKKAEITNQYLKKGSLVYLEGGLQFDKATGGPKMWSGQDGNPRSSFELRADTIKFLDSKKQEEVQSSQSELPTEEIPF